jgi:hypothetical protein
MRVDRIDRDALERAIEAARAESDGRRQQIDAKLADEPWQDVAEFASYCVQERSLNLPPWQDPPCKANLASLRQPYGDPRAARESAELLWRLLDAGLSRYEPDPLQTLANAEKRAATSTVTCDPRI